MPRKRKEQSDAYKKAFPSAMRELMDQNRTTQSELAEYLNKTRQAVSYYCDGSSSPDWETVVKIADYFDVSADYLLGRTPNKTNDATLQAVISLTGLSEDSVTFLAESAKNAVQEKPPAGFESNFVLDESYQRFYRARGTVFLVNSVVEAIRKDVELARRADWLCQYLADAKRDGKSRDADPDFSKHPYNYRFTFRCIPEGELMRYEASKIAKDIERSIVDKFPIDLE